MIALDYKWSLRGLEGEERQRRLHLVHERCEPPSLSAANGPLWCANNDDDNRSADRLLRLFQQNKGIYVKAGQHISSLDYILPYVITPRPSYSIPFHSIIIAIYPLLRIFLLSHAGSHSLFSRARALSPPPISLGHLQEFVFAMTPLHNQVRTPRPPLPPLFQALRAGEGRGDIGADDCPPPPPAPLPSPLARPRRVRGRTLCACSARSSTAIPTSCTITPPPTNDLVPTYAAAPRWAGG